MRDRVREQENGICRAFQHGVDNQVISVGIFTNTVHNTVREFAESVHVLLFARGQRDRSFIPKRPVGSICEHPHLGEFFVEASLVGRKPAPIKTCRQPLRFVFVVSTPWSGAQSKNGCFAFARSFAADLNIQPSQEVGVAGGYGMVTFINNYDSRLRDPSKLRATAPTVQSLDACDNHRCFVTLRR